MAEKFNPFDPLGLFEKREGGQAGPSLWPPPDPAGLFQKEGQPGSRRLLPPPPDPLGIFKKREYRNWKPAGSATIGNPIPIEWADEIVPLKNQARETLIGRGYSPQHVDMALHWAEEWMMGMARRMAPGNLALQKTVVVSGYSDIANRAEKWLQGIEAAFAPVGAGR
jgi:hypothetical protein